MKKSVVSLPSNSMCCLRRSGSAVQIGLSRPNSIYSPQFIVSLLAGSFELLLIWQESDCVCNHYAESPLSDSYIASKPDGNQCFYSGDIESCAGLFHSVARRHPETKKFCETAEKSAAEQRL